MKNQNNKDFTKDPSSTGNVDEGRNETTRMLYSDSISTHASDEAIKKNTNKR